MHFMVVEKFKDAQAVRARFVEKGRMMPEELHYIDSWIDEEFAVCFQLMECDNRELFDQWIANWSDLIEFEVIPVRQSKEAWQAFNAAQGATAADR
jgi:hypothetical protein